MSDEITPPVHWEEVRTTSATGGEKGVKLARYDLIPVEPLRLLAELYGRGAEKYEERNWERGYEWSKSYAALQRHVNAFWAGEDMDEEMDLPHLVCAAFHIFVLLQFSEKNADYDDRPTRPTLPTFTIGSAEGIKNLEKAFGRAGARLSRSFAYESDDPDV